MEAYTQHYEKLCRFAEKFNVQEAKDLVHNSYLRALEKQEGNSPNFAYKDIAICHLRLKDKTEPRYRAKDGTVRRYLYTDTIEEADPSTPELAILAKERQKALLTAIDALTPKRKHIILSILAGQSVAEYAKHNKVNIETTKRSYNLAWKQLRNALCQTLNLKTQS